MSRRGNTARHGWGDNLKEEPVKEAKMRMDHMRLRKARGGVIVTHHMSPHESESMGKAHVFGKNEGDKLLAHVARQMGIPGAAEEEGEPEHKNMKAAVTVEE